MKKKICLLLLAVLSLSVLGACGETENVERDRHTRIEHDDDDDDDDDEDEDDNNDNDDIDDDNTGDDVSGTADDAYGFDNPGELYFDAADYNLEAWQAAYIDKLNQVINDRSTQIHSSIGFDPDDILEYYLYDVDKDDIPELFLKFGSCEADYRWDMYTFDPDSDSMVYVDEVAYGHTAMYSYPDGNGVVFEVAHSGSQYVFSLSLEDGTASYESLWEESYGYDEEYAEINDIVPGSQYVSPICFCLDMPVVFYGTDVMTGDGIEDAQIEEIFENDIIGGDMPVYPVYTSHFYDDPDRLMTFDEITEPGIADVYASDKSVVVGTLYADINGDGQEEALVGLDTGEVVVLSIQEGNVYAYILSYVEFDSIVSADSDGILVEDEFVGSVLKGLVFDKDQCYQTYIYW